MKTKFKKDEFELYDLRVEVLASEKPFACNHKAGDCLQLKGENLSLPAGQTFTIYSLAALLPILPAKQRITDPNDFMSTDAEVACPDPHCGAHFKIIRTQKRVFKHSDVSVIKLKGGEVL